MMRLPRVVAALTLCGLLTFASSAAAECAWVLWQHSLAQGQRHGSWQWLIHQQHLHVLHPLRSSRHVSPGKSSRPPIISPDRPPAPA